ncbi:MAG: hypothetical protein ACP5D9_06185 [Mariniphaga sp.]
METQYPVGGGWFFVPKAFPVFLACGNLPENNPGTEHSHGFAVKYARHNFFLQIPGGIFNLHYLCLNLHLAIKCLHLWFNFAPLRLPTPFECKQPLQPLLRQFLCKVVRVLSSTILLRLLRRELYHYYGLICHLHPPNKFLPPGLFLLSPLHQKKKYKNKGKGFPR